MTKVSDAIIEALKPYTDTVFVLPGGFSMHLNDSLNHSGLNVVYCLHEAGAGFAACGHAQATGRLAVCLVTSGPGCTNAITACASAWQDSLPVLFLSGEAKVPNIELREKYNLRQGGAQDVPIYYMVKPITKICAVALNEKEASVGMDYFIKEALRPRRGPVWLAVPLDVQAEEL